METTVETTVDEKIETIKEETKELEDTLKTNTAQEIEKLKTDIEARIFDILANDDKYDSIINEIKETMTKTDEKIETTSKSIGIIIEDKELIVEKVDTTQSSIEKIFQEIENLSLNQQEDKKQSESQIQKLGSGMDSRMINIESNIETIQTKLTNNSISIGKIYLDLIFSYSHSIFNQFT